MALDGLWDSWVKLVTSWQDDPAQPAAAAMYCFDDAEAGQSVCMNGSGQTTQVEDASTVFAAPEAQSIPGVTQYTESVAQAQRKLKEKGYDPGKIDGLYGPNTGKAVLAFQAASGLPQTGKLDTMTMAALFDVPKAQAKAVPEAAPTTTKNAPQDQALKMALIIGGAAAVAVGAYFVWKNKQPRQLPQY